MRVAFVGHSQIPKDQIYLEGVDLWQARRGGAIIDQVYQPPLVDAIQSYPDIVFIWIGGNDLDNGSPIQEVVSKLLELVNYCREYTSYVYLVLAEHRKYSDPERTANYEAKARAANLSLTLYLPDCFPRRRKFAHS